MVASDEAPDDSASFRQVLLDSPTTTPVLGYREIGRAFATIISSSQAQFAVGIFGGWGSGKTTLMTAIKSALPADTVVSVDFNAWRFEREPQLLIPLLDTIRAALVRWSEPHDQPTREKVRSIATRIGRVVRALSTGLSAEVGIPGAVKVSYDIGTALDALSPPGEPESAQSLYVAAFAELARVFEEFSAGGASRIVVFVDDLDRCLPGNALDVLESMKLFFDMPGFVFVVGLDEDIVERAIRAKFANLDDHADTREAGSPASAASSASQRLGREYVKKIFQLPYSLPAMMPQQLDQLLRSMYSEAELDLTQFDALRETVLPYLRHIAIERRVNPREVKRFINAYILQTLIRPELDSDTVLALQTIAFRYDWESLYDAMLADSTLFVDILRRYRTSAERDQSAFEDLSPDLVALTPGLVSYLRSNLAEPLTRHDTLDAYLSSLQSTRSSRPWELGAYREIGQLRREIRDALGQDPITMPAIEAVLDTASRVARAISEFLPASEISEGTSGLAISLKRLESLAKRPLRTDDLEFAEARRALVVSLQTQAENVRLELQVLRNDSILKP